jgi:hypothetical protein
VRIQLMQFAEMILSRIIPVLERACERVSVCAHCGRNRYTGASCIVVGPANEPMGHREGR